MALVRVRTIKAFDRDPTLSDHALGMGPVRVPVGAVLLIDSVQAVLWARRGLVSLAAVPATVPLFVPPAPPPPPTASATPPEVPVPPAPTDAPSVEPEREDEGSPRPRRRYRRRDLEPEHRDPEVEPDAPADTE